MNTLVQVKYLPELPPVIKAVLPTKHTLLLHLALTRQLNNLIETRTQITTNQTIFFEFVLLPQITNR